MTRVWSRRLFLAEIVLLLPILAAMLGYAVALSGVLVVIAGAGLIGVVGDLGRASEALGLVATYVAILCPAVLGVAALVMFARVATAFLRRGSEGLQARGRTFRVGLLTGILPLAAMTVFALGARESQGDLADTAVSVALTGLPLLLPITHLALELRRAGPDPA